MNVQRWLFAAVAAFLVFAVLETFIRGALLEGMYRQTATVWRPEADMRDVIWLEWVGYLIFAVLFSLIYTKGYKRQRGGWQQGLRYGLYIGLLLVPMSSLSRYVMLPIPGALAFYWFVAGMIEAAAVGITVGAIYREGR